MAIPEPQSWSILRTFYIYTPGGSGKPFVKFRVLTAERHVNLQDYSGVQLSIVNYRDIPRLACSTWDDEQQRGGELTVESPSSDVDAYFHTVRFIGSVPDDDRWDGMTTGLYYLVFSNCGDVLTRAVVSGTVVVKNAYGFLPGYEYHKLPFYGWLVLVYVGLGLSWTVLSVHRWKELLDIHSCISFVILVDLLETSAWYFFLTDWNNTGTRGMVLYITALLLTVLQATFSYMLVLAASLGWGTIRPYLDSAVTLKVQVLCFAYAVLGFIRECVLAFSDSHALQVTFFLFCSLPVGLLAGGVFRWAFTALSKTVKEGGQPEKLVRFQRLRYILIVVLGVASFILVLRAKSFLFGDSFESWKYQWLKTDAVWQALFLMVHVAMMCLWAPHKHSHRHAFTAQIGEQDLGSQLADHAAWANGGDREEVPVT